jgi:hypothetical protein
MRLTSYDMRTPAENAALLAFIDAATSDADPGYPYGAAFIPWQETPEANRILWRYLQERRPAVIVATGGSSLLVEPLRTGRFGRLGNELHRRITVAISYRYESDPASGHIRPIRARLAGVLCAAEILSGMSSPSRSISRLACGMDCGAKPANRFSKPTPTPLP